MKKPKSFKIVVDKPTKKAHIPHRSGSGEHDSREKRLRTRQEIIRKEIEERK
jgi:hypothetical protein